MIADLRTRSQSSDPKVKKKASDTLNSLFTSWVAHAKKSYGGEEKESIKNWREVAMKDLEPIKVVFT